MKDAMWFFVAYSYQWNNVAPGGATELYGVQPDLVVRVPGFAIGHRGDCE